MEFQVNSYTGPYINKTDHHLYIAPKKGLEKIVGHYTITFSNLNKQIPDESVLHLIPDVSGCFVFKFFDKLSIKVWGPTTEVVTVDNDLNTYPCRFFVEFLPGGLYQVLGIDVHQLLDKKVELEELQNSLYIEIEECISHMKTFDEIVEMMDEILLRQVQFHPIDQRIYQWIEKINRDFEIVNAKVIAEEIGLSERQFARYFNRYVGMGVKKYSKFVNVNHVVKLLMEKKLIDIAFDFNYFDQAHFNHAFKEICGTTPTGYIENLSDFYNELYKF